MERNYTFSPVIWATTKKMRWANTYTKMVFPDYVPLLFLINFVVGKKRWAILYIHSKKTKNVPLLSGPANGGKRVVG